MDHGVILDQTPSPGFDIPNPETCTVEQLLDLVTPKAADILLKGIQNRLFVPPPKGIGWHVKNDDGDLRFAGKIKPEDRHINWNTWSWDDITRRERVLGPLWNKALVADGDKGSRHKRIIFTKVELVEKSDFLGQIQVPPGLPFLVDTGLPFTGRQKPVYVYTCDGKLVQIHEMKVEGQPAADAYNAARKATLTEAQESNSGEISYYLFHDHLQ